MSRLIEECREEEERFSIMHEMELDYGTKPTHPDE
jgi:hypothetical protein